MKTSFAAFTLSALVLTSAAPLSKRQSDSGINDVAILQYALTLEHLEATFYSEALSKYSASDFTDAGVDSSVYDRIADIGGHETTHVSFLATALQSLNQTPVAACQYNFGYDSVKTFLATASILEGVGVSAYLGAAASIVDKTYLTAAGAILTVESRHSSYLRGVVDESPFPAAFDTPLDFDEVYSLAAGFITSCPDSNVDFSSVGIKAFPALTATPKGDSKPNGKVKVSPVKPLDASGPIYAAFIGLTGDQFGLWDPASSVVAIPADAAGQTYVVLTSSNSTVSDDTILAGPAVFDVEA